MWAEPYNPLYVWGSWFHQIRTPLIQGGASVQQGLSAAFGFVALGWHRCAADKRYLLTISHESIQMRKVTDDDELRRLHVGHHGFIYNDYRGATARGASGNVLHIAGCSAVAASNTKYSKYFTESFPTAVLWLKQNRGVEGQGWRRCRCCPDESHSSRVVNTTQSASRSNLLVCTSPPANGVARRSTSIEDEPFAESQVEERLQLWFEAQGFRVVKRVRVTNGVIDLVASGHGIDWVIEAKGEDRGKGHGTAEMNFRIGISQLCSRISTREGKEYGLAIPMSPKFRRVLTKHEHFELFSRMRIWLFVVSMEGAVCRYGPDEVQPFCDSLRAER